MYFTTTALSNSKSCQDYNRWHMTHFMWHLFYLYIFFFVNLFGFYMVSVLLSAHIERLSGSRLRDFLANNWVLFQDGSSEQSHANWECGKLVFLALNNREINWNFPPTSFSAKTKPKLKKKKNYFPSNM